MIILLIDNSILKLVLNELRKLYTAYVRSVNFFINLLKHRIFRLTKALTKSITEN